MSTHYATVEKLAEAWGAFRDGELRREFERISEPAERFAPHVKVVTETGVKVLANLAFGDALKLTFEAAAHFAHCRTCGEVDFTHCDEGGREFAVKLGLYVP